MKRKNKSWQPVRKGQIKSQQAERQVDAQIIRALRGDVYFDIDIEGIACRLCIVSEADKAAAWLDTLAYFRERKVSLSVDNAELFESQKLARILSCSVVHRDTGERLAPADTWVDEVSTVQLARLWAEYVRLEEQQFPASSEDGDEILSSLENYVGKSDEELVKRLKTLEYSSLVTFTAFLVRRHLSSQTPSSPTSSSPEPKP